MSVGGGQFVPSDLMFDTSDLPSTIVTGPTILCVVLSHTKSSVKVSLTSALPSRSPKTTLVRPW